MPVRSPLPSSKDGGQGHVTPVLKQTGTSQTLQLSSWSAHRASYTSPRLVAGLAGADTSGCGKCAGSSAATCGEGLGADSLATTCDWGFCCSRPAFSNTWSTSCDF